MMHEVLRNDADCGGAHPHAQHYVKFASEITPLISAMVIARKGGGGGTGVRGRERSVVPESYASQLQSILSAYQGAKGKPPPKTGSDSACSQLKAMYPGGLPADFPTKAAVDRYPGPRDSPPPRTGVLVWGGVGFWGDGGVGTMLMIDFRQGLRRCWNPCSLIR